MAELFCKHTVRKETRWSVINPTIYATRFTTATRNPPRCEMCLAVTRDMRDCIQCDISEGDIEERLGSMEQTIQNLSPTLMSHNIQLSREVCRSGIRRNVAYCRYTHMCNLHMWRGTSSSLLLKTKLVRHRKSASFMRAPPKCWKTVSSIKMLKDYCIP